MLSSDEIQAYFDTTNALGLPETVFYTKDSLHQGSPDRIRQYLEYKNSSLDARVCYFEFRCIEVYLYQDYYVYKEAHLYLCTVTVHITQYNKGSTTVHVYPYVAHSYTSPLPS